jgi:hypothetical protein
MFKQIFDLQQLTHPLCLTKWYHEEEEEAPIFIIGKEDEYINLYLKVMTFQIYNRFLSLIFNFFFLGCVTAG